METSITYGARTADQEIISLELAKANSKIDYDDEDTLLQAYLNATADEFEGYTGRVILERDVVIRLSSFTNKFLLPVGPVTAVTSVQYYDTDGDVQTLTVDEDYRFIDYDQKRQKIIFSFNSDTLGGNAPTLQDLEEQEFPIEITVKAGYKTATMPEDIKKAALLHFSFVEHYREGGKMSLSHSVMRTLSRYKQY